MTQGPAEGNPPEVEGSRFPDLNAPGAFDAVVQVFTFLQSLELNDFVRLMSDFPKVLESYQAGDEESVQRYFGAVAVDVAIARQGHDHVITARKTLTERQQGEPLGSARAHLAGRRASGAA